MPWYRISDDAAFEWRVVKAGNEAVGAVWRAGAWSAAPANLTEGLIPPEIMATISAPRVWARALAAGLVEEREGGAVQIVDYLVGNRSASDVTAEREATKHRVQRSRDGRRLAVGNAPCNAVTATVTTADRTPPPDPDPIPDPGRDPDPTHSARTHEEPEDPDVVALLQAFGAQPAILAAAQRAPAGDLAALRGLAEMVAGLLHASGRRREDVLRAVADAGLQLRGEHGGAATWKTVVSTVRSYVSRARPEAPSPRRPSDVQQQPATGPLYPHEEF
jgi:hypothetical protein